MCSVISFMKMIFINDSSRFLCTLPLPARVRIYCFLRRTGNGIELQCVRSEMAKVTPWCTFPIQAVFRNEDALIYSSSRECECATILPL